ncbi:hypothetical protein TNCV_3028891 [Trichonephila clavipes]|nr:hypothetical protein TNCV_3028891 [Trichonephila clavipes]
MLLSSSVSTAKPSKSSFILPTACPKQSSTRMALMCWPCFQEELASCLTCLAISEKVMQPPCIYVCPTVSNHQQSHSHRYSHATVSTERRS